MVRVEGCQYLTHEDIELFEKLKDNAYQAVVDNDIIWVIDGSNEHVSEFSTYGEDFIIAMFEYMNMYADHC